MPYHALGSVGTIGGTSEGGETNEVDPLGSVDHLEVLYRDVCRLVEREQDRPDGRVVLRATHVPMSFPKALMHVQENSHGVIPRLAGAVKRASAIQDDVRAAQEPERSLVLEGERERVVRPVVQVVAELDCSL